MPGLWGDCGKAGQAASAIIGRSGGIYLACHAAEKQTGYVRFTLESGH